MAVPTLQIPGYAQPRDLDFSSLAQLPVLHRQGQARQGLADLGRGLADGTLDYRQAAAKAAEIGDTDSTLKFLALDEQRRKQTLEQHASSQFTQSLSSLYGGSPAPGPRTAPPAPAGGSVGVPNVSVPDPTPRAPVASSPTVWGDEEGVRAGIYDPPAARTQVAQAAPSPAPSITPQASQIPMLLQAMSNPNLPAGQKDIAKALFTRALDEAKPPERIKMLQMLQANPELKALELEMRAAGGTKVNIDQKGETKFEEKLSEGQAKRWNGYIAAGEAAQRKLVDIDSMREISARIGSQGAQANIKEAIGPYAEALGINVDGLSDIQAYSSIIQRLAPQQRAEGSGSTSDIEFKGFLKSLPTLSQNPAARDMTLNTMEALTRDEMARGEIATKLATKEITRVEAEKQLRALPDPMKGFSDWRKANPGMYGQALKSGNAANTAPVRVRTPDEARKLPSGTPIILPDGSMGRVP